jgi:hypothetical protein
MAAKVSVGKTAPVPLGQQPAANSLPVVFAEDQQPIPVEEQNLIQSEVALSLLGIPRAEVALGIFADVNTYDVNPTEWAQSPIENQFDSNNDVTDGVVHIPDEAGAQLIASDGNTTILTSKRFFRYQPGRVSASTMGVKMNTTEDPEEVTDTTRANAMKGAPSIKKWGIFDKFDGYYFEIANSGKGNDFRCVRRTQAIIPSEPSGYAGDLSWFENSGDALFNTSTNFGVAGVDPVIIRDGLVYTAAAIYDPSMCYAPAAVNGIGSNASNLKNYTYDSGYAVRLATYNGTSWDEVMGDRKFQFPFDQSKTVALEPENTSLSRGYIRLDAHCNFFQTISNLNRRASYNGFPTEKSSLAASEWGVAGASISSYNSTIEANTWDTAPSTTNAEKKVWHLLVNVQGSTKLTAANIDSCPTIPTAIKNQRGVGHAAAVTNGNVTLKEWFHLCVPQPLRYVYEWRPVRAMFSGDKLDGAESVVRWSDINTAAEDTTAGAGSSGAINRPGEIIKTADGEDLVSQSAYNIDFSKVTMWKTEFSWYGAVGAIFLCYVPVANGEARWVRVHHIRASNQHAVASLGNAFLPITYLTHGGIQSGLETTDIGNTLVKYGASYYIDGGDKGTVRLLSKSSDFQREVNKGYYDFTATQWTRTAGDKLTYSTSTHSTLDGDVAVGLIGAYLESDSTAKVKWVEKSSTNITLYFSNSSLPATNGSPVRLIIPRLQKSIMSVRAKDFISNRSGELVRNRLQIYPVKYGVGVSGGASGDLLTIRAYKNPLLIVTNTTSSLGTDVAYTGAGIIQDPANTANKYVDSGNSTLPVKISFESGAPTLGNGDYRYGYFLGTTTTPSGSTDPSDPETWFPVLGKIFKKATGSDIYFEKYNSYPEDIYIAGKFIPERHLYVDASGELKEKVLSAATGIQNTSGTADQTKWDKMEADGLITWEEITRLSGVRVGQDLALTPIPETGNEILAYYSSNGGYQFDLQDYFAYNKEYLSFPLTDQVDIINFFAHADINTNVSFSNFKISNALTWEEQ